MVDICTRRPNKMILKTKLICTACLMYFIALHEAQFISKQFVTTNVKVAGDFWKFHAKYAFPVANELDCAAKKLETTSQIYCYKEESKQCVYGTKTDKWMTVEATNPNTFKCKIEYRGKFYSTN